MADRTGPRLWSAFDASLDIAREERPKLLGGKGAGLVAMAEMGLPVPPGVTITTEACRRHLAGDDDGLDEAIDGALAHLETTTGRRLGDVVRVAGRAVPDQLDQRRRSPALSVIQRFQHQDSSAFAEDEAIAIDIEGARGGGRLFVPLGKRHTRIET